MRSKPPDLPLLSISIFNTTLSLRANMSTATQVLVLALLKICCQNVKINHFEIPFCIVIVDCHCPYPCLVLALFKICCQNVKSDHFESPYCIIIVDCHCPFPCLSLPLVFFLSEQVTKYLQNSIIQTYLNCIFWFQTRKSSGDCDSGCCSGYGHCIGQVWSKIEIILPPYTRIALLLRINMMVSDSLFFCGIQMAHGWGWTIYSFVIFLSNQCIDMYFFLQCQGWGWACQGRLPAAEEGGKCRWCNCLPITFSTDPFGFGQVSPLLSLDAMLFPF